jgi:uncharacterized membrane protein YbhN (UPF0104 family)
VPALQKLLWALGLSAFGALTVFLVMLFHKSVRKRVSSRLLRRLTTNGVVRQILGTIGTYRQNSRVLFAALGASLLANLLLVFVTMLGVFVVAPSNWTPRMCLVIPIGHIVNSVPLTPGGLGVGEAAFNALFKLTGLGGGAEALLCSRVWTILVGLIGFVFYLRGVRRSVFDEESSKDVLLIHGPESGPAAPKSN